MVSDIISKPIAQVLTKMTHEPRLDVAVALAVKDWLQARLSLAEAKRVSYEKKYGMDFAEFKAAWRDDKIPAQYSYEVESDYWEWEGAITDYEDIREMAELLP